MMKVFVSSVRLDAQAAKMLAVVQKLDQFTLTSDPQEAEAILMTDDDSRLISGSAVFKAHKAKCVTLFDGDVMSYYAPSLYASNHRGLLSRGRALTAGPFASLIDVPKGPRNSWISRLKDVEVEKRYLYSFMGGSTSMARKRLLRNFRSLNIADVLIECTDHYKHWAGGSTSDKSAQQQRYVEMMMASKYVLCPRGASASSIRLFEAMELGCAPVVLADSWIPVDGVDWSFCIFVPESRLHDIDAIVRSHGEEWRERGATARRVFEEHFAPASFGRTLERQLRDLLRRRVDGRERLIRALYPFYRGANDAKRQLRAAARAGVLAGYRILGRKFPYDLNR